MKKVVPGIIVFCMTVFCNAQGVDKKVVFKIIPPIFKKKDRTTESIEANKFIPPIIQKGGGVKIIVPKMSNKLSN